MAAKELEGRHIVATEKIRLYSEYLKTLRKEDVSIGDNIAGENTTLYVEEELIIQQLRDVKKKIQQIQNERRLLAQRNAELLACRKKLEDHICAQEAENCRIEEQVESCKFLRRNTETRLNLLRNTHVANDSFHIWYSGALVTINNFRVGRLPTVQVGWPEINAGLGQAATALTIVRSTMELNSKFLIIPLGSTSKVARKEDSRTIYNLFSDERFTIFPKRNFNMALKIFLASIKEAGLHSALRDPTLQLPYKINETDGTIDDVPVSIGSDLEAWTRAMKYMLTDLKWLLAWVAKYGNFSIKKEN